MRLSNWLRSRRSGRSKPKPYDLSLREGKACGSEERVSGTQGAIHGGHSNAIATSSVQLTAGLSEDFSGKDGEGDQHRQSSRPSASHVSMAQTCQDLETPSQSLPPIATPSSWPPPDPLPVSGSVIPTPSSLLQQSPYDFTHRDPIDDDPLTLIRRTSSASLAAASDTQSYLSSHYRERTSSQESFASDSEASFDFSMAREQLEAGQSGINAIRDIALHMLSDPSYLPDLDQMFASPMSLSGSRWQLPTFAAPMSLSGPDRWQLPTFGAAPMSPRSDELVSAYSVDLRTFSEAWERGLQAHTESSA